MLTLRSAHTYRPIVSPFLRAHTHVPPSLLQRHFHAGGPRLLETQHASTNDKAAHAPPPIHTVSEEVLKDKFEPGWAMNHARYTEEDLKNVKIVHKEREGWGDRIAALMVGVARTGFDIATRYPSHQQRFPRIKGSDTEPRKGCGKSAWRADSKQRERSSRRDGAGRDEKEAPVFWTRGLARPHCFPRIDCRCTGEC
jgi:hypothetical protein